MVNPRIVLPDYFEDVSRDMASKSAAIRRDFARHRPSAGDNREDLVEHFLKGHLPKRFGTGTGLIISHDGMFSKQADLEEQPDWLDSWLRHAGARICNPISYLPPDEIFGNWI